VYKLQWQAWGNGVALRQRNKNSTHHEKDPYTCTEKGHRPGDEYEEDEPKKCCVKECRKGEC